MRCPNRRCGRQTDRTVTKVGKNGKTAFRGCPSCARLTRHMHVYSGRKVWTGVEVYGAEKCKELDANYERKILADRARRSFRRSA